MGKTYIISDTHFYHQNVIMYENRPFENIKQMHEQIIENWNSVINKDDKVFILGDFSFGTKEMSQTVFRKLRGNKILIMGNHDRRKSISWWYDVGFKEVYKYPVVYNNHFILSHEPMMSVPTAYMNIHGHIHSKSKKNEKYFNVSCEVLNYTPINFEEIRDLHYNRRLI